MKTNLLAEHEADLKKSGLTDETIRAAKVYSVPTAFLKQKLGAIAKHIESALAFPYDGKFERYKLFPAITDQKGHQIKYFQPSGSPVRLYIPPITRRSLMDVKTPLYFTEGEKKALKGSQEGFAFVGLAGVWTFKQRNKRGLIDDIQKIPLNGREVFICFDSDILINPAVLAAARKFGKELKRLGARVRIIVLPALNGKKTGLDDFIAQKGIAEYLNLKPLKLSDPSLQIIRGSHPYVVHGGQICFKGFDKSGEVFFEPLCNFVAKIVEQIIYDDGQEKTKSVSVEGNLCDGTPLFKVSVTLADFASMKWIPKTWGIRAIVRAGLAVQDRLREAIQRLSPAPPESNVYTHTGWHKIGTQQVYLHAGGAIGAENIQVELDTGSERYAFPKDWTKQELHDAAMAVSRLLELGDASVLVVLFAVVHLAPFVTGVGIDFAVWIVGATGTLKSTLAALFLCFFGKFARTSLPANWESTDNALEKRCFLIKDAPLVVDDFSPPSSTEMAKARARVAERIIRGTGNNSGRERLRSDTTTRAAFRPRCFLIVTGEQLPTGQSLLARICPVHLSKGSIDKKKLSKSQSETHLLPVYMADFITQSAPKYDQIIRELKSSFEKMRDTYQGKAHPRIPEVLAWLDIGFKLGIKNLSRFVDEDTIAAYEARAQGAFASLGESLSQTQLEERDSNKFIGVVWSLLLSDRVHLLPSLIECIGWADNDYLYLRAAFTYNAVFKFLKDQGSHLGLSPNSLHKMLFEDGLLIRSNEPHRYVVKATNPNGAQERVLKLRLDRLEKTFGVLPRRGPLL